MRILLFRDLRFICIFNFISYLLKVEMKHKVASSKQYTVYKVLSMNVNTGRNNAHSNCPFSRERKMNMNKQLAHEKFTDKQ